MNQSNKQILTQANAAITRGEHETFLAFCTDDTQWTFLGDRILTGKQAVRDYMATAYIEPPEFVVDLLIEEGDFLTAAGQISLKDKDGKTSKFDYCDIWKLRDGKLAELRAFVIPVK